MSWRKLKLKMSKHSIQKINLRDSPQKISEKKLDPSSVVPMDVSAVLVGLASLLCRLFTPPTNTASLSSASAWSSPWGWCTCFSFALIHVKQDEFFKGNETIKILKKLIYNSYKYDRFKLSKLKLKLRYNLTRITNNVFFRELFYIILLTQSFYF